MKRSTVFMASDVAATADAALVASEEYDVENRPFFVEQVIAGLQEEMEK